MILGIFLTVCLTFGFGSKINDITKEPGHLKQFGTGRPILKVVEISGFADPESFLISYLFPRKPVIFKDAAKSSPAFELWTDEYFLNLDLQQSRSVNMETVKKEKRDHPIITMNFQKFVKLYKNSSLYMIDAVPDYLKDDVVLPFCLQCPKITHQTITDMVMWFSGGGTSSVVHSDTYDNINCVYRGTKDIVMIDPKNYEDNVFMDKAGGSYSSIDVDKVDYEKYPGLAQVEYIHAHLEAGDCLYIPYLWIHQVRSYGSNLAVNIWLDHYESLTTITSTCSKTFDKTMTLAAINIPKCLLLWGSVGNLKDHVIEKLSESTISYKAFVDFMLPEIKEFDGTDLQDKVNLLKDIGIRLWEVIVGDLGVYMSKNDIDNLVSGEVIYIISDHDEIITFLGDQVQSMKEREVHGAGHDEL